MESLAYILLAVVAIVWFIAMIVGMIAAFPFGIVGLIAIVGIGLLFLKVVRDRLANKDDDYYSNNVER
jgi:hypothetical protein